MDLVAVKRSLEQASGGDTLAATTGLPVRFFDAFVIHGISIDLIEHGHVICSMTVTHRLLNSSGLLHGGLMATLVDLVGSAVFYSAGLPTSGVSLEISISYVDAAYINVVILFAKILAFMACFTCSKAIELLTIMISSSNLNYFEQECQDCSLGYSWYMSVEFHLRQVSTKSSYGVIYCGTCYHNILPLQ